MHLHGSVLTITFRPSAMLFERGWKLNGRGPSAGRQACKHVSEIFPQQIRIRVSANIGESIWKNISQPAVDRKK